MPDARDSRQRRSKPPLLIIFARGGKIRHISMGPIAACGLTLMLGLGTVGNIGSATYLLLRDGLLSAVTAPRLYDYEERIASLRAQITEIGAETAMEQHGVYRRVAELLEKQELLAQRQDRLEPRLGRITRTDHPAVKSSPPLPTPRPERFDMRTTEATGPGTIGTAAYAPAGRLDIPWPVRTPSHDIDAVDDREAPPADAPLEQSLVQVERRQLAQIETLTNQVYLTMETIEDVLELAGLAPKDGRSEGGPLPGLSEAPDFSVRLQELDEALDRLDELKRLVQRIPVITPLPGARITSRFGSRRDPFLKQVAYHSGLDFRARKGDLVRATSTGRVTKAGWYGGYGRMVEIDHGSGLTTRYAHLHEVLVNVGDRVVTAAPIARAGNSGRSTGPHLHYEVRRHGEALNPLNFIQAGRQLAKIL